MTRPGADPFGEGFQAGSRARLSLLGGDFTIESSDSKLLQLAVDAFGGLPRHRLNSKPHRFKVRLTLSNHKSTWPRSKEPPQPVLSAGGGLLCATVDAGNFAVIDIAMSRALISVSTKMMQHPYHARHELIELAFLTLASRAQQLVPLHAACVGAKGNGLLLMGNSATGKSTLSLQALAAGMQYLSEDSAFVELEKLRVTGVPNYLHVQSDSLAFLPPGTLREQIECAPVIQRRSGAIKHQFDVRRQRRSIARSPLILAGTVFLTRRKAGNKPALKPLDKKSLRLRLRREQPYAAARENWREFERQILTLPAHELNRTEHPQIAVELLRKLLGA